MLYISWFYLIIRHTTGDVLSWGQGGSSPHITEDVNPGARRGAVFILCMISRQPVDISISELISWYILTVFWSECFNNSLRSQLPILNCSSFYLPLLQHWIEQKITFIKKVHQNWPVVDDIVGSKGSLPKLVTYKLLPIQVISSVTYYCNVLYC